MVGLSANAPLSLVFFGVSSVTAWVVPAILFVLVIIASWMGIRWAFSHEMSALRSAPLFSGLSTDQGVTLQLSSRGLTRTLERYPSIARLIFLKLRTLLQAEGDSVPPDDAPVDQSVLIDVCQRLRKYRDLDWSPSLPSRRRSLLRR